MAGIVNAIGFLGFQHQGVSHLTGTTTLFGMAIAGHNSGALIHLAGIAFFFLMGATLSGFVIQDSALRLGRRYGAALLIESVLLAISAPLLTDEQVLGDYLISAACGLQNAMVSTYSGASLRTTHLTGAFTDLGIFLGHAIRRALRLEMKEQALPLEWRRLRLLVALILSFALGGSAGAWMFPVYRYHTLYIPAALTGAVGTLYGIYAWNQRQKYPGNVRR
ncbi:MAG: YoaK family protein [Verrucomicrobiales bacterium]